MRLIDADALVSALNNGRLKEQTGRAVPFNAGVAFALTMVEYAQTIDAYGEGYKQGRFDAEADMDYLVRRGHWEVIDAEEPRRYGCSECKRLSWHMENYCPNCGARMDGEQDDD